ncbi:hypothetical protein R1sor_026708 [Riccia sorocarpa]|uniref:Uncharacterized protein n=1 Tax=Riccia sorocarpa TaxID=122646 RepID=A0ABD3GFA9_9MARC
MKGSSYGDRFSREQHQTPSPNRERSQKSSRSAMSSYTSTPRSPASSCGERPPDLDPEVLDEMLKKKMTSGRFWKFMRGCLETHPRKKRERQRDCRTCEGHEHRMETILQEAETRDRVEWTKKMLYRVDGVNMNMANQRTSHPCHAHNEKIEESLKYIKSPRRKYYYENDPWNITNHDDEREGKRSDEQDPGNESRKVRIKERVTQITDKKKSRKSRDKTDGSNPRPEIPTPTILKHSENMRFSSPERVVRNPKPANQKVMDRTGLRNNLRKNIPVNHAVAANRDNLTEKVIANVETKVTTQRGHAVLNNQQENLKANLEKQISQVNEHLTEQKKPKNKNFVRSVSTVKREVTKPDQTSQAGDYSSAPRSSIVKTGNCKRFVHQEEACKKILLDHEESPGPYLTRQQLGTKARARSRTNSPCKRYLDHDDKSSSYLQKKHHEEVILQEQAKEWRSPRAKHVQSVMKQGRDVRMAPSPCRRFLSNDRKSQEYLQKKYEQEYFLEKSVKESRSPVDEHVKSVRQRTKGVPPPCNRFEQQERNQRVPSRRPVSRTTPAKLRHQNLPVGHQGQSSQSCDRSQKHHDRSERFFEELESSRESTPGSRGFWDLEEELRNHEMYRDFKRRRDEDICSKSMEHERSYSGVKGILTSLGSPNEKCI